MIKDNLRFLRQKKDLTQKDLSVSLGVAHATINHWERGKTRPTFEHLVKISEFYGIDMNNLVEKDLRNE